MLTNIWLLTLVVLRVALGGAGTTLEVFWNF